MQNRIDLLLARCVEWRVKRAKERFRQCEDALLDLSEHEQITAQATAHILARYPECRDPLRRLVEGFALAYELPQEDPTACADAFVIGLADKRHFPGALAAARRAGPPVSRFRVRRPSWAPLAMAAAALLSIALGTSLVRLSLRSQQGPIAQPTHPSQAVQPPSEAPSLERIESRREAMLEKETEPPGLQRIAHRSDSTLIFPKLDPRERQEKHNGLGESGGDPLPRFQDPDPGIPALAGGTSVESKRCKMRVAVFEKLLARGERFTPSPAEQLEVGLCYGELGNHNASRKWLTEASHHQETKARAMAALEQLD